LVSRLNSLAPLNWLLTSSKGIGLTIDPDHPQKYELVKNELKLGISLASQAGHFERSVLLAWVQMNWPEHDELTQEVMADILTWSLAHDLQWTDPTSGEAIFLGSRLKYSLTSTSLRGYCQSPVRSEQNLDICARTHAQEADPAWTMRPLISRVIWSFVRELPSSAQIRFYKALLNSHFENSENEEIASDNLQSWSQNHIRALLKHWSMESELNRTELVHELAAAELLEPIKFDLTVEADPAAKDRVLASVKKWSRFSPKRKILFAAGDEKIALPEDVRVDLRQEEVQTQRFVLIACDWPEKQKVLGLKARMFYGLRVCAHDELPAWNEILAEGIHVPSAQNSEKRTFIQ
jgi:hypothetical protein